MNIKNRVRKREEEKSVVARRRTCADKKEPAEQTIPPDLNTEQSKDYRWQRREITGEPKHDKKNSKKTKKTPSRRMHALYFSVTKSVVIFLGSFLRVACVSKIQTLADDVPRCITAAACCRPALDRRLLIHGSQDVDVPYGKIKTSINVRHAVNARRLGETVPPAGRWSLAWQVRLDFSAASLILLEKRPRNGRRADRATAPALLGLQSRLGTTGDKWLTTWSSSINSLSPKRDYCSSERVNHPKAKGFTPRTDQIEYL